MRLAQRLQLTKKELVFVAFMWVDVIRDRRRYDITFFQAHHAEWMESKMMPSTLAPPLAVIQPSDRA